MQTSKLKKVKKYKGRRNVFSPPADKQRQVEISCIIPTRDRREMVLGAIESVFAQIYSVSEVIAVDDGSLDGTSAAIRERFKSVRVIATDGIGPGPARNAGVSAASGDIIMFLDSDDRWLPGHVSALMATVKRGYQVAYGVTRNIDQISQPNTEFLIPDCGCGIEGQCFKALTRWCFLVPSSVCMTKDAFKETDGFSEGQLGEDWIFFLRLSTKFPFGFTEKIITSRILHHGSLCHTNGHGSAIENALSMVARTVRDSGLAGPDELSWLDAAQNAAREESKKWKSVQDWFIYMKTQGLL